jgi:hypothetical protein
MVSFTLMSACAEAASENQKNDTTAVTEWTLPTGRDFPDGDIIFLLRLLHQNQSLAPA